MTNNKNNNNQKKKNKKNVNLYNNITNKQSNKVFKLIKNKI